MYCLLCQNTFSDKYIPYYASYLVIKSNLNTCYRILEDMYIVSLFARSTKRKNQFLRE